ncbi:hypothetical protein [Streptomyces candidus]|uniref:Uncharacterized protein n=1 Tax=Streptomyces candidus TaxID=67283 RepID=A0A7X0HL75_9ACTN|nr:hypothetical protein [Streptomyces candidus]MBB6439601.1 hypothetical protein [Streptomyces candidus]
MTYLWASASLDIEERTPGSAALRMVCEEAAFHLQRCERFTLYLDRTTGHYELFAAQTEACLVAMLRGRHPSVAFRNIRVAGRHGCALRFVPEREWNPPAPPEVPPLFGRC